MVFFLKKKENVLLLQYIISEPVWLVSLFGIEMSNRSWNPLTYFSLDLFGANRFIAKREAHAHVHVKTGLKQFIRNIVGFLQVQAKRWHRYNFVMFREIWCMSLQARCCEIIIICVGFWHHWILFILLEYILQPFAPVDLIYYRCMNSKHVLKNFYCTLG